MRRLMCFIKHFDVRSHSTILRQRSIDPNSSKLTFTYIANNGKSHMWHLVFQPQKWHFRMKAIPAIEIHFSA